jgi:hypothetical protein
MKIILVLLAVLMIGMASTASDQEILAYASGAVSGANLGSGNTVSFSSQNGHVQINTTLASFYNPNSTRAIGATMNDASSVAGSIINKYPNEVKAVGFFIYDGDGHVKGVAIFPGKTQS